MKKILFITICLLLFAFPVFATNTYTTDLNRSDTEYWSIADASETNLDVTDDFSFMAWLNVDQLPSTAGGLFGMYSSRYNGDTVYGIEIRLNSNDTLFVLYSDDSGNNSRGDTDSAFVVADDVGNWVHVAITVDVSAQDFKYYKNGVQVDDTNLVTNASSVADDPGTNIVGAYQGGAGGVSNTFDGQMDDVRIYADILTEQEIQDYYDCSLSGGAGEPDNLVANWLFDNDGTDETANGNDLTNNNSATFQSGSLPYTDTCGGGEPPASNPCQPTPGQPFFQSQDCYIKSNVYHNERWITNGHKLIPMAVV
jgi:hypothetical protein